MDRPREVRRRALLGAETGRRVVLAPTGGRPVLPVLLEIAAREAIGTEVRRVRRVIVARVRREAIGTIVGTGETGAIARPAHR